MSGSAPKNKAPKGVNESTVKESSKDTPSVAKPPESAPPSDAGPPTASIDKRRLGTGEDPKLSELGLRGAQPASGTNAARHGNQRRTPDVLKLVLALLGVMLAALACFAAMLYSYYQKNLLPEMLALKVAVAQRSAPQELETSTALTSTRAELRAAQNDLIKAQGQITHLQKQLTALQDKQDASDDRMTKFAEHMQTAIASNKPTEASAGLNAAMKVASLVPMASPTNQELWILKERNRLTFYADQAISQGSSEAMTNLWHSLDDPELVKLREGVQAEIIRVQNYYAHLSRLPADYRLPVRELMGDPAVRNEADVKPAKLIEWLLDQKQPFEVRARSAFVLGGHRSGEVSKALLQCMKSDPVLDVVKEAQRTLEEDYGMRVPPLHLRAAEEWEKAQTSLK